MSRLESAVETQIVNLQKRTGKSLDELFARIRQSGLTRHAEIRDWLKRELGAGHGDANLVVHLYLTPAGDAAASPADPLATIYAGAKADLRPLHERLMAAIEPLGPFEIAPKKGYVSLRRKKQFAMVGPATRTRIEVGLNLKGLEATPRLLAMPPGGMCQYKVHLTAPEEIDPELVAWIRQAYESAG